MQTVDCRLQTKGKMQIESKGPGKRGQIVADTLLPTQMFPRLPARATFVADTNFVSGTKKCFWFCSETLCIRNKCFPVCAAQETWWAKMCPQQCVLVCQGLKTKIFIIKTRRSNSDQMKTWGSVERIFFSKIPTENSSQKAFASRILYYQPRFLKLSIFVEQVSYKVTNES